MSDYTPTTRGAIVNHKVTTSEVRHAADWGRDYVVRPSEFDAWLAEHDAKVRAEERERCASLIEPGFRIGYVTAPGGAPVLDPTEHANHALHRAAARIRERGEAGLT